MLPHIILEGVEPMTSLPPDYLGRIFFIIQEYGLSLLRGAGKTLLIAIVGTVIGCIIGYIVGIIQTIPVNKNDNILKRAILRFIKLILNIYVEVFRGTPMMVQAVFIYYGSMMVLNVHMEILFAAFFIVSINTGAYMAETVRGGILSIDEGQTEGAKSIGMTHFQTMFYVILPQATRNIMPQIGNNLIINIKDTCVLSIIGIVELFYTSNGISGTYYVFFETFTLTMIIYLIMTFTFSRLLRWFEKKMDGPQSYALASNDVLAPTSGMLNFRSRGGDRR